MNGTEAPAPMPPTPRLLLFVGAALVTLSVAASAQSADQMFTASRQQLDVTKIVLAQESEWNQGNLEGYLLHFKDAADTEAVLNGPVRGLANIRSAYRTAFPNRDAMGQLEQSEVEVRELGRDYALATGKYRLTRSRRNGGEAQGTFLEVFEKTSDGWQLIFSQAS